MIRYQPTAQPIAKHAAKSCSDALVAKMAEEMREMAFAGENVSAETLKSRGWTEDTIKRLSGPATERARRLSVRRVA
ncbi:MAG: hypothetical protein CML31_13095 [Rhizobiales bacterium]|nr:hypothetical protein [Hyphomicrobiales bacterium]|tara:strand:- start:1996 stop:2226 length:231 start_codon:yes stop_codon:yes gene_type:complete